MTKNGTRNVTWVAGTTFVLFSGAVAFKWLYTTDLWVLRTAQEHHSGFLDGVLSVFPFLGSVEVMGTALLVLLMGLFLRDCRTLAGRILAVFVATALLELAMKFYLPQVPISER